MKTLRIVILVVLLLVALPASAHDSGHTCPHNEATLADLGNCIVHAAEMGHIDNHGVLRALQAKLRSAQTALDRGQLHVAIHNLNAFINLVEAQSGKHIAAEHAPHMIHHAEHVIAALSP